MTRSLLLVSGGLDSACVAMHHRPERALFVDYGQRPANGERRAARAVADATGTPLDELDLDLRTLGDGLLTGTSHARVDLAPTPEWFPYRNQFLVTAAAAIALRHRLDEVWIGLTADDAARHADGTPAFVEAVDRVVSCQEGGVRVIAPAHKVTSAALLAAAAPPPALVRQTISCHRAPVACGLCPGCAKRTETIGG